MGGLCHKDLFGTTFLSILIALFAAYALSRYKFRGKGVLGFVLFATQMLPEALLLVPLYVLFLSLASRFHEAPL